MFVYEYDQTVLDTFLKDQLTLFPEPVASSTEEARDFLEMCMAVVVSCPKEVFAYLKESGVDISGMSKEEVLASEEIFALPDGRYLIVEA